MNRATLSGELVAVDATLTDANLTDAAINGYFALAGADLSGANLKGATVTGGFALTGAIYSNTSCPDGSNSDSDGGTCVGHGV
jgi:uncharacterized protein YjbI with pentapeptide repeats